ncbi:hypothetical protein [Bradyrhizobium sp. STM 3561]|uniref:hypothetical protein n=1 Tax=Bradyrhizobium sp. STM 3561 TaxID=578923 RepID=UPI00388DE58E
MAKGAAMIGKSTASGSLAPIWNLVAEELRPSMAREYVATAQKVMVVNGQAEARRIVLTYAFKHIALRRRRRASPKSMESRKR